MIPSGQNSSMLADIVDIVAMTLLIAGAGGLIAALLRRRGGGACSCSCSKLVRPTDDAALTDQCGQVPQTRTLHPGPSPDEKETDGL